jgi:hypothetical protein
VLVLVLETLTDPSEPSDPSDVEHEHEQATHQLTSATRRPNSQPHVRINRHWCLLAARRTETCFFATTKQVLFKSRRRRVIDSGTNKVPVKEGKRNAEGSEQEWVYPN